MLGVLRAGNNFSVERQIEPLVMDSEISGLPDLHAFLKHGNEVARFSFTYNNISATQPAFLPRPLEDDDLAFDPKTLEKKPPQSVSARMDSSPSAWTTARLRRPGSGEHRRRGSPGTHQSALCLRLHLPRRPRCATLY
jgi:hypothetical protein